MFFVVADIHGKSETLRIELAPKGDPSGVPMGPTSSCSRRKAASLNPASRRTMLAG
jgi:hypothetical protein